MHIKNNMKTVFTSVLGALLILQLLNFSTVNSQRSFEPNDAASGPNVDAFWVNVTGAFENYIRDQSIAVNREWKRAVLRGQLKTKVSKRCLDVVERIIRKPLEERWSAQSKI